MLYTLRTVMSKCLFLMNCIYRISFWVFGTFCFGEHRLTDWLSCVYIVSSKLQPSNDNRWIRKIKSNYFVTSLSTISLLAWMYSGVAHGGGIFLNFRKMEQNISVDIGFMRYIFSLYIGSVYISYIDSVDKLCISYCCHWIVYH